jgi:hypothetical protein
MSASSTGPVCGSIWLARIGEFSSAWPAREADGRPAWPARRVKKKSEKPKAGKKEKSEKKSRREKTAPGIVFSAGPAVKAEAKKNRKNAKKSGPKQ